MRFPRRIFSLRTAQVRSASSVPAGVSTTFVPACSAADARSLELLQDFVSRARRLFVITGAGLSTESGIPDYRSEGVGLYARTDRRPMQHAEFVRSAKSRQRYWARNFAGWPQFSSHEPNSAHRCLRRWEESGKVHWLVTQNVDALHSKAGQEGLTELHGCAHRWGDALFTIHPGIEVGLEQTAEVAEELFSVSPGDSRAAYHTFCHSGVSGSSPTHISIVNLNNQSELRK